MLRILLQSLHIHETLISSKFSQQYFQFTARIVDKNGRVSGTMKKHGQYPKRPGVRPKRQKCFHSGSLLAIVWHSSQPPPWFPILFQPLVIEQANFLRILETYPCQYSHENFSAEGEF